MLSTSDSSAKGKKKKKKFLSGFSKEEEGSKSEEWPNESDFLYCVCGFIVGYGNFIDFPLNCYRNGGGTYVIAYVMTTLMIALPLLLFELTIGQLTKAAVGYYWFCPLLRGIGFYCSIINAWITAYYTQSVSMPVLYLSYCFQSTIPWQKCQEPWATPNCRDNIRRIEKSNCTDNIVAFDNGTCYDMNTGKLYGVFNMTLAKTDGLFETLPAYDFFMYESVQFGKSRGIIDMGPLIVRQCLCLALVWIFNFIGLLKGVTRAAKVIYLPLIFSIIVMTVLLVNSLTMSGSGFGLMYFFYVKMTLLTEVNVWKTAVLHSISSIGLFQKCLPALASHNRLQHNVVKDVFLLAFLDIAYSLLAAVTVFSCVGVLAKQMGASVHTLFVSGYLVALAVYPQALSMLPMPRFWNVIFLIMQYFIGATSALVMVEVVTFDTVRLLTVSHRFRRVVMIGVAVCIFLFQLTLTRPGGTFIYILMRYHSNNFATFMSILFGIIAIAIYGPKRMCKDIEMMVGSKPLFRIPWMYFRWYFIVCWQGVIPTIITFVAIHLLIHIEPLHLPGYVYPLWADGLGWTIEILMLSPIFFTILWDFYNLEGPFRQRFMYLLQPYPKYERLTSRYTDTVGTLTKTDTDMSTTASLFGSSYSETLQKTSSSSVITEREDVDDDGLDDLSKAQNKMGKSPELRDMKFHLKDDKNDHKSKRTKAKMSSKILKSKGKIDKYERLYKRSKRQRRTQSRAADSYSDSKTLTDQSFSFK